MDQNKLSDVDLIILKHLYQHIGTSILTLQEVLTNYGYILNLNELKLVLEALINQKLIVSLIMDSAEVFAINVATDEIENCYAHFILNNYSTLLNILSKSKLKFDEKEFNDVLQKVENIKNKPI